ncbi:hypothetical protein [Nocardia sp. CC227C]|uniref:hypothetical protein n=1 Tax=Nocardia sp. CC227C TaxID=3044562 RepID=UPI00278BD4A6|nr:hypothetical protein [Nocardia sp. CC227C]
MAAELNLSLSATAKKFRAERRFENEEIIALVKFFEFPAVLGWKVADQVLHGIVPFRAGRWPPRFAEGDLELLSSFSGPGMFMESPVLNIMAKNAAADEYFPWLKVPTDDCGPVNLVIELFTNPGALESFGDSWDDMARHAAMMLNILAPGIVETEVMAEIFERCRVHPKFDEYLNFLPTDPQIFAKTEVMVRCPDGVRRRHIVKSLRQDWPDPEAWVMTTMVRVE